MVRTRVRNSHDADDVVQETLLLAFRHFEQFRFEASFCTWLYRIAINVIRGRLRRPETWRSVVNDLRTPECIDLPDPGQSALAALERTEAHSQLYAAVARLPALYQEVVELRDFKDQSLKEAAAILHLSVPAIKSRHHRARSLLRSLMRVRATEGANDGSGRYKQ
jgi:RNA polymerase sigma-70 factor (ECF subfamily)